MVHMAKRFVLLQPGRRTKQRPDETPSQAMNRLTAGDGDPLPRWMQERPPKPRFRKGGA